MAKEYKVSEFIKEIKNGEYVIPHFQRDFDWKPNMVADLFKSIINGYYAGTILLWDLRDSDRNLKMWDPLWGSDKSEKPTKAILDGQQRLSSMFYALVAPQKKFPNRETYYYFYINLDELFKGNEDESIQYWYYTKYRSINEIKKDKNKLIEGGLFPICLLSDENFMDGKEYEDWINEYVESRTDKKELNITPLKVARRIEGILKYSFLTETLEKKELKEICTIFANINSKGLKLSIFDLMNAFLYPHGIKLKKDWEKLDNVALKEIDLDNMKVYILKLISLYKQKYCSSRYLYNLIPGSKIKDKSGKESILIKNPTEFTVSWLESIKYSEKARKKIMNSGTNDFGAIKNTFIPNTTLVPVIGALMLYYDKNLKNKVSENVFDNKIKKLYWAAILSQDYSGSSDSIMAKDYEDMQKWLEDDSKIPERISKITNSFINSIDLTKIKNTNNSQYCAILNLLALELAKDFFNERSIGTYPVSEIHDHHIFPTKCGLNLSSEKRDSILNRTLIFDTTNQAISNDNPSKYYKKMIQKLGSTEKVKNLMKSHLISEKALGHLAKDEFEEFIEEREKTIKSGLKKILEIE